MKFKKASEVANIVYSLKEADRPRSENRALINQLFNGDPPWSVDEERDNNINTNVNFLDAPRMAHDARGTLNNAFLKPGNFFKVKVLDAPVEKKMTYESVITSEINRPMKKSMQYMDCNRSQFAQVVLHGVGPIAWETKDKWCPYPVALSDLKIPSGTKTSFENLGHFAIFRQYSPHKLYEMTHGEQVDKAWNMKLVNQLLAKKLEETSGDNVPLDNPEKLEESLKSNVSLLLNDQAPTINCWDFYFKKDKSTKEEWNRRIILDSDTEEKMGEEFLYNPGERVVGESFMQIVQAMFADGANVAPFLYHSVRGLGWLLYSVCHLQNRLMCRFNDAVFEQAMWYFRVQNPEDRERLNKVDLHHLGVIPEGLSFVPADERYTPNMNLFTGAFALNRQNMAESSSNFRQDINDGTQKEMTAEEARARMNTANALVGSMLNLSYIQKTYEYEEIARRFCIKNSTDPDVKKFQERCIKRGVPKEFLDHEKWEIEIERVLGAGNKTLEIAQARELMAVRPLLDPPAQREVLHIFVESTVDDPKLAERLVPSGKKEPSDSVHDAQLIAAALMMGLPVSPKKGGNRIEYIEALLISMGAVIDRIEQTGIPSEQEFMGLNTLASYIGNDINLLAQDREQAQRVKKYGDALGKYMNLVKAYGQRLEEKKQAEAQQNGITPEAQAKIRSAEIVAQATSKIKDENAAQKRAQKEADFAANQARKDIEHQVELGRQVEEARIQAESTDIQTAAKIRKNANPKTQE